MDKILLGKRIKEARLAREYTLDDLASAIHVHKSTISRYERGEIDMPKLPVIESIANELHTNPSWLCGKSNDKSYSPRGSVSLIYTPNNIFAPLKEMREQLLRSPESVAFEIGISTDDYLAIESGKYNPDCVTLIKLALLFCCDIDHILSFAGVVNEDAALSFIKNKLCRLQYVFGKLNESEQEKVIQYASSLLAGPSSLNMAAPHAAMDQETADIEKVIRFSIPGYATPLSAGTGQEAGQEYPENYTLVKEPPRGTSFIARVSGNSMEPTYHDGDLVFVHSTEEIPIGRVGAFFMNGQQWVKELGNGVLISHNAEYSPVPMREDIRCQGLVLGVCDESFLE